MCEGTLDDYFNGKYKGPKFKSREEILLQVTQGLDYLDSLGIVHRNMKPTNILISAPNKLGIELSPQIKLSGFGSFKTECFINTSVTNPYSKKGWILPEVYESNGFDLEAYLIKKEKKMVLEDMAEPYSNSVFYGWINSMMTNKSEQRPSAKGVLNEISFIPNLNGSKRNNEGGKLSIIKCIHFYALYILKLYNNSKVHF